MAVHILVDTIMDMDTTLQFSVIIPTHQRPELILRCLDALKAQTFDPEKFEVIVIPSPDDPSISSLNNYSCDFNLKVIQPDPDPYRGKNVSFKRNFGAKQARAPWLAYTDDDCVPSPQWLEKAWQHIHKKNIGAIEGKTVTPENSPRTLTWKGMQRLSNPGGYQTCNIFYNKEIFLKVGMFDTENFPWYLEDSDAAWSVLDSGHEILHEPEAVVVHPVGPAAHWRLTHEALNTGLKLRLRKKHPKTYASKKMKTLRFSQYFYFGFSILTLFFLISGHPVAAGITAAVVMATLSFHMFRLFKGLNTRPTEVLEVAGRTLLFPFLAIYSVTKIWIKG